MCFLEFGIVFLEEKFEDFSLWERKCYCGVVVEEGYCGCE